MFNNVMVQDGLICDDVGWWSEINKGGDRIYDIDIVLCDILEGMWANSQVVLVHGSPIGSSGIVVDGGRIT